MRRPGSPASAGTAGSGLPGRPDAKVNRVIAWVLRVGLLSAVTLMIVGAVLAVARSGAPVAREAAITDIPRALAALEPGGFFDLGFLVLVATPVARVLALGIDFGRRRSWLFFGVSVVVLALLALSAILGLRA